METLLSRILGPADDTSPCTTFDRVAPATFVWTCVGVAIGVGLLVRWPLVAEIDFPLNDGALFLVLIEAVLENGFALPESVVFNGGALPFAYPPLSFYVVALVSRITGIEPLSLVTYLPLLMNLVCIGLFVLFAARLCRSRSALFLAAFMFPLIPRSYEWLIMGGGVSRSVGMLCVLGALLAAARASRTLELRWLVASTCLLAASLASHLEWGITGWVSVTLLLLAARPSRRSAGVVFVMGCAMGVLTVPWWGLVLASHGLDPFLAASSTSGFNDVGFPTRLVYFDLFTLSGSWLAVVAAIGLIMSLTSGDRRLRTVGLWLFLIYLATPRHAPTVASMPVAILVAVALSEGIERVMAFAAPVLGESHSAESTEGSPRRIATLVLHGAICISAVLYIQWELHEREDYSTLHALTPAERAGMQWIHDQVEENARFLVVSSATHWEADRASEWFPVLAERRTVNTIQGLEWNGNVSFAEVADQSDLHRQAAQMSPSVAPNLGLQLYGPTHSHVAVFAEPGSPIRDSYRRSHVYETIAELEGVSVLRLRPEIAAGLRLMDGDPLSAL